MEISLPWRSAASRRERGRALLLCLACAEAGWLILVNAWLRLERAYLKAAPVFARVSRNSQEQKWGGPRCSDRGTPPDEATQTGTIPLLLQFFDPTGSATGRSRPGS